MMTTGGDGPSVFAKYIDGPENARPAPLENLIKQSRRHADLKTFLMDILIGGPVPVTLIVERGTSARVHRKTTPLRQRADEYCRFQRDGKAPRPLALGASTR